MGEREDAGQITVLLEQVREGQPGAEDALIPLVYAELRRLAHYHLRGERAGHTLQTTALVHEAFLKLTGNKEAQWADRKHFFAMAATLMRRILVDYARARRTGKRGGAAPAVPLNEGLAAASEQNLDQILDIHEALSQLAEAFPRQARVVELKFFAGLDLEEIADLLGIASRTVKRDWKFAQAWLYDRIQGKVAAESAAGMSHKAGD